MPHEFNGESYKQSSTHQKEWGNKIIAEFDLRGSEHILDLGCGDGALTAQLAELVPQGWVLGIDASKGMIQSAQKLAKPNLRFELQDINALNYIEQFDLIFSNATLHWVKDHPRLLENCLRSLKPNGLLRVNFAGAGNCGHLVKVIRSAMQLNEYSGYFRSFEWPWYFPGVEEYASLVKQIPFKEVRVWGENADRFFATKEDMIKWIDQPSLVPFLKPIPADAQPSFRNRVVVLMLAETLQPDGRCFETFRRINLSARK